MTSDWKNRTCESCEFLCMASDSYSSAMEDGDFECRRFPPVNEMDSMAFMYPIMMRDGVIMKACAEYKPDINEG